MIIAGLWQGLDRLLLIVLRADLSPDLNASSGVSGFCQPWFLVDTCGDGLGDRHIIDGLFDIGSHYISVFLKGATLLQSWSVERASSGHTVICFLTSLASFRNG